MDGPAVLAALDDVHDLVGRARAGSPDLSGPHLDLVETALAELVGNVIRHGAAASPPHLRVELSIDRGRVQLDLRDDGLPLPFDPADASMPDASAESGRGVPMASAAAHELSYRRVDDANVWSLAWSWP